MSPRSFLDPSVFLEISRPLKLNLRLSTPVKTEYRGLSRTLERSSGLLQDPTGDGRYSSRTLHCTNRSQPHLTIPLSLRGGPHPTRTTGLGSDDTGETGGRRGCDPGQCEKGLAWSKDGGTETGKLQTEPWIPQRDDPLTHSSLRGSSLFWVDSRRHSHNSSTHTGPVSGTPVNVHPSTTNLSLLRPDPE